MANLIGRCNELANETAGDHVTPREVIRLMVNLLFIHDDQRLATACTVRKLLDPACGTGGTGGAGSSESEIRRWLLDNDWFEALVALPEAIFYNTGIGTYPECCTNSGPSHHRAALGNFLIFRR